MDATFFKGWCPLQLGDKIETLEGETGTVTCIRTIQDLSIDDTGNKKTEVFFEFYCVEFHKYLPVSLVKQQWWTEKSGVIQTRILNK